MSHSSFLNFEMLAGKDDLSDIVISGRYEFQKESEKYVIVDIKKKLELSQNDSLLEIGCGTGNLLIPLSADIKKAHGIDNHNAISRLIKRDPTRKIDTTIGTFQDAHLQNYFSKILIYSVIHYLSDLDEVIQFIKKALSLLEPNGTVLIGDIPNIDKKKRYLDSKTYQGNKDEWNLLVEKFSGVKELASTVSVDQSLIKIGDKEILELIRCIRDHGFEAFLMPQPLDLPFSYTRDDILIKKIA